jgi:hypothetical protein
MGRAGGEPEKRGAARFGTLFPNRVANRAEALTMRRAFIENKADGGIMKAEVWATIVHI